MNPASSIPVVETVVKVPSRRALAQSDENQVEVPVQVAGTLEPNADRVILVAHDFHRDYHAAGRDGWWLDMIGPGRPLDTNQYTVISPAYVRAEPAVQGANMDCSLRVAHLADGIAAVLDALDIPALHAMVGGGSGGLAALTFAARHPHRTRRLISVASGARVTTLQSMHLAHQIAALDLAEGDRDRLELAWRIFTVRRGSLAALEAAAHSSAVDDIDRYLSESSQRYWESASPHSLRELLWAWRHFDLAIDSGSPDVASALSRLGDMQVLVLGVDSDTLFYPTEQTHLTLLLESAGVAVPRYTFHSEHGHDGWIQDARVYGPLITDALAA